MINPKIWLPKLVLLDRDGVINHDSDRYIKTSDEWNAISGSIFGIVQLQQLGIKVAVCTNQAGIGRGLIKVPELVFDNTSLAYNDSYCKPCDEAAMMAEQVEGMDLEDAGVPMVKLGDASIAAPFTSKLPSIRSCVDIVRQGHCTLVSTAPYDPLA